MAWLRVDDKFAEHRKIVRLSRSERWTWLELLCYVARQNNGGHVSPGVTTYMKHVTPRFLTKCQQAGLLDVEPESGDFLVHDWEHYNPKDPTAAERMRRHRRRNSDP